MRTGSLLCSETTEGMEPLGAFNQPVYKSYGQIRAALLNELGKPFADYFARPDLDADATRIGWVAHDLGEPRRWIDMTPAEQTRLDPARQRIQDGFTQYRAQLDAAPQNSPRSNFGKLLAQASCVPGPQYLYFVGDQPVVAFWGFKTMGLTPGFDPLRLTPGSVMLTGGGTQGADEAFGEPPLILPPEPKRRSLWWLWLLALLLLLGLLFWLWAWWTHRPVTLGNLFGPPPPIAKVEPPPIESLPHDTTRRSDGVLPPVTRDGVVVPPVGTTGINGDHPIGTVPGGDVPANTVPTDNLPPANVPSDGGLNGSPTDHSNAGPPVIAPPPHGNQAAIPPGLPDLPPAGAPADRGQPLGVPADATPGPAAFMQGVWRSRSGLVLGGKPAEEYYRFDKSGQGEVTLRTRDGSNECTGPVQAVVGADHRLSFNEAPQLTCSDGTTVAGAVTQCRPGGDRAACQGTNQSDGSHFGVQIDSVRKP